ncbi:hypothetical protein ABZ329_21010 [Streptomyces rubiginosohelvolus]|uniref:hypothetical protein n=1 Tax=Streptomyces TaxID=1883 RepID=UPI000BF212FF|nr:MULTISPECIES: hypothetical protein [unclassified Streptomyces]MZG03687.1 hypothetical protein [Streptomyces sp. SID5614]
MSFEQEWGELKAAAAMRLNQAGGSGPKGSADFVVKDDELGGIGHAAFDLFNGLETAGKHAKAASGTAGKGLKGDGFDTGAAFTEVIGTWEKQVKSLLQACAHISNHLDYTKASRKADDEWLETQLRIIGPVAPDADASVPASQLNKYFR